MSYYIVSLMRMCQSRVQSRAHVIIVCHGAYFQNVYYNIMVFLLYRAHLS